MFSFVRSLCFSVVFYGFLLFASLIGQIIHILPSRYAQRFCQGIARFIPLCAKWILRLDWKVEGLENMPSNQPTLWASKHQSSWETFFLMGFQLGQVFIVKRELLWVPFFGWLGPKLRMIPVSRHAKGKSIPSILPKAKKIIAEGRTIIIFPEGTRTAYGTSKSYRSGIAALYEALSVPVVPIAHNAGYFWPRRRFMKRPGTIVIRFLPPIQPGLSKEAFMAKLETQIEETCRDLPLITM